MDYNFRTNLEETNKTPTGPVKDNVQFIIPTKSPKLENKTTLFEALLYPIRKRISEKTVAREFSSFDSYNIFSESKNELADYSNKLILFKDFLSKGEKAKRWKEEAERIISSYQNIDKKPYAYWDALSYLGHIDARNKYLQLPQIYNLVEESKYKPSKSISPSTKYYKFKFQTPEYWNTSMDEDESHLIASMKDFVKNNGNSGNSYAIDLVLNNFIRGYGVDPKKGQYMSIYDIWDYNTKVKGGNKDNIATYIGAKPFEIYDRIYLDDYYKVNSKPNKGEYYGGYIPEIIIRPK